MRRWNKRRKKIKGGGQSASPVLPGECPLNCYVRAIVFDSAMSLIEMSQQHRTAPSRATFAIDFNTNNDANSSTDKYSSELVGSGIRPSTEHFTPTRRYSTYGTGTSSSHLHHTEKNGSRSKRPLYLRNNLIIQHYCSRCHGDLLRNHTAVPDQSKTYPNGF